MAENLKNWRQGNILREHDAQTLGLVEQGSGQKVIVISHDCDIPSDSDDYIEFIIAECCTENKLYRGARHPRILNLSYKSTDDEQERFMLLKQVNKSSLPKSDFVFDAPDSEYILVEEEKRSLKQWLASRYGRPAFPDEFENRMKAFNGKVNKKFKFESSIAKILEKCPQALLAVFFSLGEGRFIDLPSSEPYELSIYIVYDSEEGGPEARDLADSAAAQLLTLFHTYYGKDESAVLICLEECIAISDTKFSLSSMRKMDQWRLDYISLAGSDGGEHVNLAIA